MSFEAWILLLGCVLIGVAFFGSILRDLPLTAAMLYFAVGVAVGPIGFGVLSFDPVRQASLVERLSEIAVIISLFTTGLKLRIPLRDGLWWLPVRLAFVSMTLTVGLIATASVVLLGLPWGAGILLGAILAPTDPVLASEVQIRHAGDRERLRFSLSGEAGLNDGTAFPFVMLGLGMLGLHELGDFGWRWLAIDVLWAILGGVAIGAACGYYGARLILHLRERHSEGLGYDQFLALGLIGVSYGSSILLSAYGFLAVFAAGLALRAVERERTGSDREPEDAIEDAGDDDSETAKHPHSSAAKLTDEVLDFNEELERVVEVALVLTVGAMLTTENLPSLWWIFVPVVLLIIRPVAVLTGLIASSATWPQRGIISWLGMRGIGSIYYLSYAVAHGLPDTIARQLTSITVAVIAISIIVHGLSATVIMRAYSRRTEGTSD
ncbi:MAG: sodium:proton antiporter [Chthoniobacterales bacterium]